MTIFFNRKLHSDELFTSNARTAFKIGLVSIGIEQGQVILIPEFICNSLLHPIIELNLIPVFYPINSDFSPRWEWLDRYVAESKCVAIIMVHYFGQPQNILLFESFCERHSLYLIEDNAHGYSGRYLNRLLGSFGDVGISSPRKFLSIPSGGILHRPNNISINLEKNLESFPRLKVKILLKQILYKFPRLKRYLSGILTRKVDWNDPYLFQEKVTPYFKIDRCSQKCITTINWDNLAIQRRQNWSLWSSYVQERGLSPVFDMPFSESCPWAMPALAKNQDERNAWLEWGSRVSIPLFTWPSLPDDVILKSGCAVKHWKRLVCFPLDISPMVLNRKDQMRKMPCNE